MSKQGKGKTKVNSTLLIVLVVLIALGALAGLLRCSIPKQPDTPTPSKPSFEMEFDNEHLIF